ncbi:uncharacterized protein LOC125778811 [Bactrocera dorsalis]|uniref:Regulatory protein zeste n=1 Tax=Bactrocera dorsalis TaxID=27457 RepID=A0ABM3JXX1_BACDO|nr:uncharacterized protein LOC125778811 [Bactrocera dorsalis]
MESRESLRTTKEQIECYLAFLELHPQMKLHKNDPTRPKRLEELWIELAQQLNALKGPSRSPTKWKECLNHWKNQIRSRARKAKVSRILTGGGPMKDIQSSELEERAIEALGRTVVDGLPDVPTIGVENDIIINMDPQSPLVCEMPSTSRSRRQTSQEMFADMMAAMQRRSEEEAKFRETSQQCFEKVAESLNNMASAIVQLSEAVLKKN